MVGDWVTVMVFDLPTQPLLFTMTSTTYVPELVTDRLEAVETNVNVFGVTLVLTEYQE